jgi:hypothetical protein
MVLTQTGSLNALGHTSGCLMWRRYLRGEPLPSPDRIGDVACLMALEPLRGYLKAIYKRIKRRKAIKPVAGTNLPALAIDGHECCGSYHRSCRSV